MQKENGEHKLANSCDTEKASIFQVAQAVLFSFIGIRKKSDLERDAARIRPLQAIIGGLVGGVIFVLSILLVVRFVTG
jgi:hypothetical protein